jgi:vacuolar-type H+-ATPase subunit I/STV1
MEYKNLHSYKEFLNEKNMLNEGLFGKLFKWLSGKIHIIPINNMYAQAKLIELQELILKKKIEYYKEELKVDATKLISTQQEELKKKSETIIAEMDKAIKEKDGQENLQKPVFEIGKKYNYTRQDKSTTTVTIKEVEDGGKEVTKVVDDNNNEFNPITSSITPIKEEEKGKEGQGQENK